MTRLQWHKAGESRYQTGVDRGVLFVRENTGEYGDGVPWNGLTTVTESPSGAESSKTYADNQVYVNIKSAEEFAATIEALMSPPEFDECDGAALVAPGTYFGQQARKSFGFSWRGLIGNELEGTDFGYRIHLAYGLDAAPSEKANATVNESPEPAGLSWEATSIPVDVGVVGGMEYKPVAHIWFDSTLADPEALAELEAILYGDDVNEPRLPMPSEVVDIMGGTATAVNMALAPNQPTFVAGTGVITLPAVTGVQWKVNGVNRANGAQPPIASGDSATVTANAQPDYYLEGDDDWTFERP